MKSTSIFVLGLGLAVVVCGAQRPAVRAYSNPEPEAVPNLARKSKVSASGFREGAGKRAKKDQSGPELACDGGFGNWSRWRSAESGEAAWIELDFGTAVEFDTLRLYSIDEEAAWTGFRVLTGNATPPTNEVAKITAGSDAERYRNRRIHNSNALLKVPPQRARYLRLEFAAGGVWLDELEVFRGQPQARTPIYEPGDARIRMREAVTPQVLARSGDLLVWFENAIQRVFRDEVVRTGRAPEPVCRVSAARGEVEPFQVVVQHPKGLRNIRLEASSLQGPGEIPASAVRWNGVGYVYVRLPSFQLVRQNGSGDGMGQGWYPDYLLQTKTVDAPAGKQQPLWVTVDVPRGAKPGEYRGKLRLTADGGVDIPLQLRLNVWDFEMPATRRFKAQGREHAGLLGGDKETAKQWYKAIAAQGFSGPAVFWPSPTVVERDGRLVFDWRAFDEMAEFAIRECGFTTINMSDVFAYHETKLSPSSLLGRRGLKADTPPFWASLDESLTEWGRHLKEKGWVDRFVLYVTDEPNTPVLDYLIRVIDLAKRRISGIRVLWIGGYVTPELVGKVDIWGPNASQFDIPSYSQRARAGDMVWTYSNTLWEVDSPPSTWRALPWAYSKYGISGVFFYNLNSWRTNPYEEPRNNWSRNGDPMHFYPQPSGKDGPAVPSLRMEMARDGWDDWEYLRELTERLEKTRDPRSAAAKEGRQALEAAHALVYQYGFVQANREELLKQYAEAPDHALREHDPAEFEFNRDPDAFLKVRERVARAIVALK